MIRFLFVGAAAATASMSCAICHLPITTKYESRLNMDCYFFSLLFFFQIVIVSASYVSIVVFSQMEPKILGIIFDFNNHFLCVSTSSMAIRATAMTMMMMIWK